MKFLVIGDLHIGVGSDDPWQEMIREKLLNQVIEYATNNNINRLVFLGDVFDDRRSITHRSLELSRKLIIEPIQKHNLEAVMIIGNHDAAHINKLTPNAVTEVFGNHPNFKVVESIETVDFEGTPIDFVSWICKDNEYEIREYIKTTQAKYCFGHFELVGFYYYSGNLAMEGDDPQFLSGYDYVGSGHYHTQNGHGNVHYLGTPFTITSNDDNEIRGFWEFDTNDMKNPKLIPNPKIWHRRISYPFDREEDKDINYDEYKDVRLVVELNAPEDDFFKEMEEKFEDVVNNIKVRNNFATLNAKAIKEKVDENVKAEGGPLELAYEFINNNEMLSDTDKEEINKKIYNLYMSALSKVGDD